MIIIKLKNNHKDKRGSIADIFYKKNINHVALIISKKGIIRGNNYFRKNIQHVYNLSSPFEYWYKKFRSKKKPKKIIVKKGQLLCTPPMEIHALKFKKDNKLLEFSSIDMDQKKKTKDSKKYILFN